MSKEFATEEELRAWLSRARALEEKRAIYEEAVTQARARATATTRGYDMRVSGSRDPHARMDALAAASELVVRLFEQQITARKEIFEFIYSTLEDSRARAFMVSYYINGLTIKQSAQKVGASLKHGFRIQKAALSDMLAATHNSAERALAGGFGRSDEEVIDI